MKFEFQHGFEQQEALDRVRALTDYWSIRHGVNVEWKGNVATVAGKAKGISFSGHFVVDEKMLSASMKVGFLAERLGGRSYVEGKLRDYLNPANSLETLRARIG